MAKATKTPAKKSGSFKKDVKAIVKKPKKAKAIDLLAIPRFLNRRVNTERVVGYTQIKGKLTKIGESGQHYNADTDKKVKV